MHFWLTSLAIFAEFLGIATAASHRARNNVCMTQECYDTASRIKKSMNLGVNPCDDFYEYTCGNYMKNTIIPEDDVRVQVVDDFEKQYQLQVKSLLEADIEKDDIRLSKLAKTLYKSCMNEDAIKAKGLQPLKELLKALGGWPVLEGGSWNESNFDWIASMAEWYRVGFSPASFMKIVMKPDPQNSSHYVLLLREPMPITEWRNPKRGFSESQAARDYHELVNIAVSLGADRKRAEDELKKVSLFQIELTKLIDSVKSSLDRMTLKELIKRYPRVNWRNTFARMYSSTQIIGDEDIVIVHDPEFLDQVIDLVLQTPQRVLANFAMFQIVRYIAVTNRDIDDLLQSRPDGLNEDTIKRQPRWSFCIEVVKFHMPLSVAVIHARKFLRSEIKVKIEDLIREIRGEFRTNLHTVTFLDAVTEAVATKKEKAIKSVVGYPDGFFDNGDLDHYYENLELFESDYFVSVLHLLKFHFDQKVRNFRKPVDKTNSNRIMRLLLGVKANAAVNLNSILFSTGILQGAVFNPERPRYMNFGTLGFLYGHELIHFFDTEGSRYDENGNKKEWWTSATKQAFEERVKCFVDQYGNYIDDTVNLRVNGNLTLDENIADNGGAKIAYRAYVKSMRGKAPEKRLPGLDYTPNQMYWLAFSNLWCGKTRPDYLKNEWTWEPHTVSRFRVIGTVSNSKEFANDFKCPLGSKMNPVKKCSLW